MFAARVASATPADEGEIAVEAHASATMSLAQAPYPSPEEREISGLLTTLLVEAQGTVAPKLAVAFRWPLVLADVDLPAGAARTTNAWGHPEGALFWRFLQGNGLVATLGGALAVPLLGDDDAALGRRPFDNQALLLASAQTAWRDSEIFAPGRLALTPAAEVAVARGRLVAFAHLDFPLLLALRRGSADDRVHVRTFGGSVAVGAGMAAAFLDRLTVSAAPWVVIDALPAAEIEGEAPPRWTLSLATALKVRVRGPLTAELGSTVFLAGALSGFPSFRLALGAAW
jgi:hypothetical protein